MRFLRHLLDRLTGRADTDLDRELRTHLEAEAEDQLERTRGARPDGGAGTAASSVARHRTAASPAGSTAAPKADAGSDSARSAAPGGPSDEAERVAAREAARRVFGNVLLTKEDVRQAWGWTRVEQVGQDLRYAVRTLRRSPVFTAVAVLSLALGIGANTTIFGFLHAVVLRPLPYPEAERIVFVQEQPLGRDNTVNVHPFNFLQWQARSTSFDALALAQMIPFNTKGPDGAEQVSAMMTTEGLFPVFGVPPFLGRWLAAGDMRRGSGPVVVVSYEFWQRRLGADPGAIGSSLLVNNAPAIVVGVMPPRFRVGTLAPDLYVPLQIDPANPGGIGSRSFLCFGRLRSDRDVLAGRAEMTAIMAQLQHESPIDKYMGVSVVGLYDSIVRSSRKILALLMGVVLMVLLIACLNLASLLLTRGIARQHELAIHASLGAGRMRLVQRLLIESLVLSAAGGALGVLLAIASTRALLALTTNALTFGRLEDVQIDWPVLAFTIALATLTALLCGLLPAWSACRVDPHGALRERGRGRSGGPRQTRFHGALVIGEVTIAVVLLVGSGLLLRTFSKLLQVELGFTPEHVLTMTLFLPDDDPMKRVTTIERILDRVGALPNVRGASTIKFLPVGGGTAGTGFRFERGGAESGGGTSAPEGWLGTEASLVSRGYFATMGIPLLEGRVFDAHDRRGSPRVVIVSRAFVRRFIPDGHALGKTITVQWSDEAPTEIIGVVGDVSYTDLVTTPRPTVYLVHEQTPGYVTHLVVRATGDPAGIAASVRHEVQAVDPTKAVSAVKTMEDYVSDALARPRLYASMLGAFAALALLLAGMGLYGLMAYGVSQRSHEIGIRMALGAQRRTVIGSVLRQGARLAFAGLALGLVAAFGLTQLLASLLFGVTPTDAATYTTVALVLAAVATLAAFIPARRAARVDPMIALRCD